MQTLQTVLIVANPFIGYFSFLWFLLVGISHYSWSPATFRRRQISPLCGNFMLQYPPQSKPYLFLNPIRVSFYSQNHNSTIQPKTSTTQKSKTHHLPLNLHLPTTTTPTFPISLPHTSNNHTYPLLLHPSPIPILAHFHTKEKRFYIQILVTVHPAKS